MDASNVAGDVAIGSGSYWYSTGAASLDTDTWRMAAMAIGDGD